MKILQLHADDNVAVLTADVASGEELIFDGACLNISRDLSLGDKVALKDLALGDLVYKYGIPIGSTTKTVVRGEWIHLHNMKSDYVPTYVFNDSDKEQV